MSPHNYGISREDRAEMEVARKGWEDFFKRIEQEDQHHYAPGSSSTNITSSNPPGPSSSASSTPGSNIAQSQGKRKSSAVEGHMNQSERKTRRIERADTSTDEEEGASESPDDPTKFCPGRCLFCIQICQSFDQNLDHMKYNHHFFIPFEGSLSPRAMPPMALIHYIHRLKNNDPPALLEELCDLEKTPPTSELFSHALNRAIARRERGDFIEEYRRRFRTGSKISHHREAIITNPDMAKLYFTDEWPREWLKGKADGPSKDNI